MTSAILVQRSYQLSYQADLELVICEFVIYPWMEKMWYEYMKVIYLYCGKYFLSNCKWRSPQSCTQLKQLRKKEAWKTWSSLNGIQTNDLCDTSAAFLPTELSSQPGAGHWWFRYIPVDGEDVVWTYESHIFVLRKILFKQMTIIAVMYST